MSTPLDLRIASTWDGEPIPNDEQVSFNITAARGGLNVVVEAPFYGDPPPLGKPGPCDRLWECEVAELFIVGAGGANDDPDPLYIELELSPHGHYLMLRLRGIRQIVESLIPVPYRSKIQGRRWRGNALVPRHLLPPPPHRLNAFAIHGIAPWRRYLAMTPVPGPEPDFHRLESFETLELPSRRRR